MVDSFSALLGLGSSHLKTGGNLRLYRFLKDVSFEVRSLWSHCSPFITRTCRYEFSSLAARLGIVGSSLILHTDSKGFLCPKNLSEDVASENRRFSALCGVSSRISSIFIIVLASTLLRRHLHRGIGG